MPHPCLKFFSITLLGHTYEVIPASMPMYLLFPLLRMFFPSPILELLASLALLRTIIFDPYLKRPPSLHFSPSPFSPFPFKKSLPSTYLDIVHLFVHILMACFLPLDYKLRGVRNSFVAVSPVTRTMPALNKYLLNE